MVQYRLETGRWLMLHPGIYCHAGTPASWLRDQAAAAYWCKGAAAARAAGRLFDLPGCEDAPLEVLTTPTHKVMPRCGIVVHLTKRLPTEQLTAVDGIPATTIERTVMDLCGVLDERRAAIALDNALFRGLTTCGSLDHCLYLTARRGRNGCGVMRKLLKKRLHKTKVPNSPLETVIFEMFSGSTLPMPELQYVIRNGKGDFVARPDFVYPGEKLIIEGHSKLWHSGELAREADARRERRLRNLGYLPIFVSWTDATVERERTMRMIERLHAERSVLLPSNPSGDPSS